MIRTCLLLWLALLPFAGSAPLHAAPVPAGRAVLETYVAGNYVSRKKRMLKKIEFIRLEVNRTTAGRPLFYLHLRDHKKGATVRLPATQYLLDGETVAIQFDERLVGEITLRGTFRTPEAPADTRQAGFSGTLRVNKKKESLKLHWAPLSP